jgi:hypothetical protein
MSPDTNGWSKSELYVMEELQELGRRIDRMEDKLTERIDGLTERVTGLRVEVAQKGAVWGAVSGAATAVMGWLAWLATQ